MKNIRKLIALFCALLMILTLAAMPASALGLGKTKVGISWQDDPTGAGRATYAQAVIRAGGRPVYLPLVDSTAEAKEAVDSVDAVSMTGGEDINPALYGEAPSQKLETVNKERDTSDTLMLKEAISEDKPTLCICRGCQMLNVVRGGTLYQDLPTELPSDVSHRASGGNRDQSPRHRRLWRQSALRHHGRSRHIRRQFVPSSGYKGCGRWTDYSSKSS